MPLPLSSTAIEEKNKLATDSVFLVALEISVPGLSETIYVVHNTESITWRGHTWIATQFELNEIRSSSAGEAPRVDIRVDNTQQVLEYAIHEYETYCKVNYRESITCKIYVVNSLNLASSDAEVEHEFELLQPRCDSLWMTFTLGASNPFNRRYPLHRLLPMCRWKFKDADRCQYSGSQTICDKSFTWCKYLGNTKRWGGFYPKGRI